MIDRIFDNLGWIVLLLFAALLVGSFQLSKATCYGQWENSGLQTGWGPIKGCIVQTPSGRWLPSDSLRDVDLNPTEKTEKKPD